MSHIPTDHPMRPLSRAAAVLTAGYLLVFGAVGVVMTMDAELFGRADDSALGLRTNLAFALASAFAGAVVLLSVFVGRGVDYVVNVWGGVAFMVAGLAMLPLLNTDLNVLNFSVATVVVSFVIGMVLFSAGLYIKGGPRPARTAAAVRH